MAIDSDFRVATSTQTSTTPAGRSSTAVLDPHGRVATVSPPGVPPISLAYDPRGRLHQVTQGSRVYTIREPVPETFPRTDGPCRGPSVRKAVGQAGRITGVGLRHAMCDVGPA